MIIKKILSINVAGIYLFKFITNVRLFIYKLTKNDSVIFFHYNQTKILIEKKTNTRSNCIDLGASKGDILDVMIKYSPKGNHIVIEPLPVFYSFLKKYYKSKNIRLINAIASDYEGTAPFYYQTNEPAISGFSKVNKQLKSVKILNLPTIKLDSIVNPQLTYDLLKIDCIGSELSIIKGAIALLEKDNPLIIFDFIKDHFNEKMAEELYETLSDIGYSIFLLTDYPNSLKLDLTDFKTCVFDKRQSHFFANFEA